MTQEANHGFADRLMRANFDTLSDEHLRIAIFADSPNSSDESCRSHNIYGQDKKRVGAVAQILRDYPEQVLVNPDNLAEMTRIKKIIYSLPGTLRKEVLDRLMHKKPARSPRDTAEK